MDRAMRWTERALHTLAHFPAPTLNICISNFVTTKAVAYCFLPTITAPKSIRT